MRPIFSSPPDVRALAIPFIYSFAMVERVWISVRIRLVARQRSSQPLVGKEDEEGVKK
jgi:hypothetical protein